MPKMKPEQYTAQKDAVLALAARPEGVTVNEIIEAIKNGEKNISRPRAEKLVKEVLNLPVIKRDGRTQHFGTPGMTALPPVTKTATTTTSKKGTSVEARLTKLGARVEKAAKDLETAQADLATLKAEVATASVIEVVPASETPVAETAPATETANAEAPAAAN